MELTRDQLSGLIPHAGTMCLIDQVTAWDEETVTCRSATHRDLANPLRRDGRLDAVCGIEYAAQAMAIHGALIGQTTGDAAASRPGYLAAVRNVTLATTRLDDIAGDLLIRCRRLMSGPAGLSYDFELSADDRLLLSGRTLVTLRTDGEKTP